MSRCSKAQAIAEAPTASEPTAEPQGSLFSEAIAALFDLATQEVWTLGQKPLPATATVRAVDALDRVGFVKFRQGMGCDYSACRQRKGDAFTSGGELGNVPLLIGATSITDFKLVVTPLGLTVLAALQTLQDLSRGA